MEAGRPSCPIVCTRAQEAPHLALLEVGKGQDGGQEPRRQLGAHELVRLSVGEQSHKLAPQVGQDTLLTEGAPKR